MILAIDVPQNIFQLLSAGLGLRPTCSQIGEALPRSPSDSLFKSIVIRMKECEIEAALLNIEGLSGQALAGASLRF